MTQGNSKNEHSPTHVRLIVEVDGNPVGSLNLDMERLWPLINHSQRDISAEWMEQEKFDSIMRAAVTKRLLARIQERLYQTLGDEMVKAELDIESFTLKADAAAQVFGKTKPDLDRIVAENGKSANDFHTFFWEYMLDDREVSDLRKEWKHKTAPPR